MPDMSLKMSIRKAGHTQKSLADAIGVARLTVTSWVRRGYVTPPYVAKVSAVTGVPMQELNPSMFAPPGAQEETQCRSI